MRKQTAKGLLDIPIKRRLCAAKILIIGILIGYIMCGIMWLFYYFLAIAPSLEAKILLVISQLFVSLFFLIILSKYAAYIHRKTEWGIELEEIAAIERLLAKIEPSDDPK